MNQVNPIAFGAAEAMTEWQLKTHVGDYEVHTILLPYTHDDPYETRIFRGDTEHPFDDFHDRYDSEQEAFEGHELAVDEVEKHLQSAARSERTATQSASQPPELKRRIRVRKD